MAIAGPSTISRIHHAVEDQRARGLRITARVVLRHARAIGAAVEIDALVAERAPHRVEIAHRDAGGVHAQVGFLRQLVAALDVLGPDFDLVDALENILVAVVAVEAVRTAGAALIHQHDVAIAAHAIERRRRRGVQVHGRSARAAGDQEQRIGRLVEADGRHARDEQLDLAAVGLVGIFGDRERCRIPRAAPACARDARAGRA